MKTDIKENSWSNSIPVIGAVKKNLKVLRFELDLVYCMAGWEQFLIQ